MLNKPYIISLDIESGGISKDASLLTCYSTILDSQLNIIDDLYLYVKPDNNIYIVEGQGMRINGIDLGEHDTRALSYKEAGTIFYNFLQKNKGENPLKPLGHNIRFDLEKIANTIISHKSMWQFISYRTLDTGTIAGFAAELGLLPKNLNAGLASLAKYFGVGIQEEFGHDARRDVMLTIGVYKALLKLFQKNIT